MFFDFHYARCGFFLCRRIYFGELSITVAVQQPQLHFYAQRRETHVSTGKAWCDLGWLAISSVLAWRNHNWRLGLRS